MKILDMLENIETGQTFDIGVAVKIGEVDVHALNTLSFLYNELPEGASFADAERVLSEAIWWHITFNTLIDNYEGHRTSDRGGEGGEGDE